MADSASGIGGGGVGWTELGYDDCTIRGTTVLIDAVLRYGCGSTMPDSESVVGDVGRRLAVPTCRLTPLVVAGVSEGRLWT